MREAVILEATIFRRIGNADVKLDKKQKALDFYCRRPLPDNRGLEQDCESIEEAPK